ncbi:MAG: hypothetical protein IJV27_08075 [Prevotella sp.]|nr:hypothetical protein [Prevotella sp.]
MKNFLSKIYQPIVILLWGMACFVFFQFFYKYHFFYQEQNQLFLISWEYVATYFRKPAWTACLVGDFLTQFYYYLYAGPAILTLSLLVLGDFLRHALQRSGISKGAFFLALLSIMLEAILCLHYAHRLSAVMAMIGGAAMFLFYSQTQLNKKLTGVYAVLTYWMFGIGVLLFALLAVLNGFLCFKKRTAVMRLVVLGGLLLLIPLTKSSYLLETGKLYTYPGFGRFSKPDFFLEKQLAVDNEYYFGNYDEVVWLVESEQKPSEHMLFFYNLVQAQRGTLPDNLLKYYPNELGTFYQIGPDTPLLIIKDMNELYWSLGDMTFTERAAMMANVFSPDNRNVRMVKRLAECNIVSGDTAAVRKYLGLLEKTLVWRNWAKNAPTAVYYGEKQRFVNRADTIRTSDNAHMIMMELLDSNPENIVALDYILCSNLLLKDIANFKRDYDRYCISSGRERLKDLYQQALCIWLAGTDASQEEWGKYIKRQDIARRFMEYSKQRGNPAFKDTYWYYFDTAKQRKL